MENFTSPIEFCQIIFHNVEELTKFLEEEVTFNSYRFDSQYNPQYILQSVKTMTSQYSTNLDTLTKEVRNLLPQNNNQPIIHARSIEAEIVKSLGKQSSLKAKGALAFFTGKKIPDGNYSKETYEGFMSAALSNQNMNFSNEESFNTLVTRFKNENAILVKELLELNTEFKKIKKTSETLIKNQTEEIESIKTKFSTELKEQIDLNKKSIDAHEKALNEKHSLESSTIYWGKRAWISVGIIFASIVVLILSPFSLNLILSWIFDVNLKDVLTTFSKLNYSDTNKAYGATAIFIFSSLSVFYFISTMVKIMINQLNIINSCLENITKTRYFVSLVNQKIMRDEDRGILISSVFNAKYPHLNQGNIVESNSVTESFKSVK